MYKRNKKYNEKGQAKAEIIIPNIILVLPLNIQRKIDDTH